MRQWVLALGAWLGLAGLAGCAAGPNCAQEVETVLRVGPATAGADSGVKAPGNTVQFTASTTEALRDPGAHCGIPALAEKVLAQWTVSDPKHVTISSAQDETNGLATCTGTTDGPVTVTASTSGSAGALTATATLSCQ